MCSLCNFLRIVYVPVWHTDDGGSSGQRNTSVSSATWQNTLGSRFATVSFTTIHFYDPLSSRTERSRLVAHRCLNSSVLSPLSALVVLFRCACVSSFSIFSAVLLSWLWFSHPRRPSKRQKRRKNQNSWRYILSWCLLNHGLGLLQQNKKWSDWYIFFSIICNFTWKRQKRRKKIKTFDITFFSTTSWAFFSKIKSDLTDIFFSIICNFTWKRQKRRKKSEHLTSHSFRPRPGPSSAK